MLFLTLKEIKRNWSREQVKGVMRERKPCLERRMRTVFEGPKIILLCLLSSYYVACTLLSAFYIITSLLLATPF